MPTTLSHLSAGEQFEIPNLSDTYRNLTVLRQGDCSVLVDGQIRTDEGTAWVSKSVRLALSTQVESKGTFIEIKETLDGNVQSQGKERRGRKSKQEVEFPEGEFKIKELAAQLKIPYYSVMNSFNRQRANFKQVRTEPNGGRGKPVIVWIKK